MVFKSSIYIPSGGGSTEWGDITGTLSDQTDLQNALDALVPISSLGTGVATFLATPSSSNLAAALTDETGSGAAVFGTSPTLTTPNIVGTSTNDNAAAGSVGQYVESEVASGSAVALTTITTADITSISLPAGDWDVWGVVLTTAAGTTATTNVFAAINTTSATLPTAPNGGGYNRNLVPATGNTLPTLPLSQKRISLSGTTTVYMVIYATFTTSTLSAWGGLYARRRR